MLVENKRNLYGVYWTSGISSILMGIYYSEDYDTTYDVLEQFAEDKDCFDFNDYIDNEIMKYYGNELDNIENNDEYDRKYNEYFQLIINEYSVQPIDIEIKKGE